MGKPSMFYGAKPALFEKARQLRNNMTYCEFILWDELMKNKLGVRFKAQHPIKSYIVDFYCHKLKLVIEIDGSIHDLEESVEYDEERTFELEQLGLKVIRFTNNEVKYKLKYVVTEIRKHINP